MVICPIFGGPHAKNVANRPFRKTHTTGCGTGGCGRELTKNISKQLCHLKRMDYASEKKAHAF